MAYPPELKERAREMRKQGNYVQVIAEELGVSKPTVVRWTNLKVEKRGRIVARRKKYSKGRKCPKCKTKMSNNSKLCRTCFEKTKRYWTRERIIDAVQYWAERHGYAPTHKDWTRSGTGHPAISSIITGPNPPFKNWSEVLIAAGFKPRARRNPTRITPQERAAMRRELRENRLKRALEKGELDEHATSV